MKKSISDQIVETVNRAMTFQELRAAFPQFDYFKVVRLVNDAVRKLRIGAYTDSASGHSTVIVVYPRDDKHALLVAQHLVAAHALQANLKRLEELSKAISEGLEKQKSLTLNAAIAARAVARFKAHEGEKRNGEDNPSEK